MCRCIKLILSSILFLSIASAQNNINFTIDLKQPQVAISPYIYGTNNALTGSENWTAFRQGGNRLTGYNWENNASNAGFDYIHNSDNYLTYTLGIWQRQRKYSGYSYNYVS